ncbi:MAG: GNAT family N-acetyltransferase [Myxococcota bacterium]
MSETQVREADLDDPAEVAAVVEIIDSYARGPGGRNQALSEAERAAMGPGLRAHPAAFVLLAYRGDGAVGVAVCVWGFSTFAGKPSLNVHDLAVLPDHQGQGVGQALLAEAERRLVARDGCKLTLEVHDSNEGAKRLYRRFGFGPWEPATLFVSKPVGGA